MPRWAAYLNPGLGRSRARCDLRCLDWQFIRTCMSRSVWWRSLPDRGPFRLIAGNRLDRWTVFFLATTVATSVTGFGFPIQGFTPGIGIGIVSLVVLAAGDLCLLRPSSLRRLAPGVCYYRNDCSLSQFFGVDRSVLSKDPSSQGAGTDAVGTSLCRRAGNRHGGFHRSRVSRGNQVSGTADLDGMNCREGALGCPEARPQSRQLSCETVSFVGFPTRTANPAAPVICKRPAQPKAISPCSGSSSRLGINRSITGDSRPRRSTEAMISLAQRGQGICSILAIVWSIG